jgi:hypothetical protein
LDAGTLQPLDDPPVSKALLVKEIDAAHVQLADLRSHQPDMSLDRLAIRLADPRRADPIAEAQEQQLAAGAKALAADQTQWEADAQTFNVSMAALKAQIETYQLGHTDAQVGANFKARITDFDRQRADLDRRKAALERRVAQFNKFAADQKEVGVFSETLQRIVMTSQNLSLVRDRFESANAREVAGWIRTPSYVISQDIQEIGSVGGHDIDARALRLVPDRSIADMQIVGTPDGRQLHYNPNKIEMADHAAEVSRAVEHGDADVQALMQIVSTNEAPRARNVALDMESPDQGQRWAARIGTQRFATDEEFVTALRTIKTQTPCCRVLAKDANDAFYLAETNTKPPPTALVTSFGDTASLGTYMARHAGEGDLIALDQPREHVEAIVAGLDVDPASPSRFDVLKAAARRFFGRSRSGTGDHVMLVDLRGRPGGIDPPGIDGAPPGERVGQIVRLAGKRTEGARVEPVTPQDAAKIVGGIDWTSAADGAPRVVRVRFGDGSSLDTVAGFRSGDAGANQRSLDQAVASSVELASAKPGSRMIALAATIKNELKQLSKDQLGRVLFVVREEGGANKQFTLAPGSRSVSG